MSPENKGTPEVLTIAPEEFQQMQSAVLDGDGGEALRLLKQIRQAPEGAEKPGLEIAPGVEWPRFACSLTSGRCRL